MPTAIRIQNDALLRLIEHAEKEPRKECCGLLAGGSGVITRVFAVTNAAADPAKSYEIAPKELFPLMRELRAAGLEMMGIYHSHPNGNNEPSPLDIERSYYPDAAYFILSPSTNTAAVRAFSIRDGFVTELTVFTE